MISHNQAPSTLSFERLTEIRLQNFVSFFTTDTVVSGYRENIFRQNPYKFQKTAFSVKNVK